MRFRSFSMKRNINTLVTVTVTYHHHHHQESDSYQCQRDRVKRLSPEHLWHRRPCDRRQEHAQWHSYTGLTKRTWTVVRCRPQMNLLTTNTTFHKRPYDNLKTISVNLNPPSSENSIITQRQKLSSSGTMIMNNPHSHSSILTYLLDSSWMDRGYVCSDVTTLVKICIRQTQILTFKIRRMQVRIDAFILSVKA